MIGIPSITIDGYPIPSIIDTVQGFANNVCTRGMGQLTCDFVRVSTTDRSLDLVDDGDPLQTIANQYILDRIRDQAVTDISEDYRLFDAFLERIGGCPDLSAGLVTAVRTSLSPRTSLEQQFVVRMSSHLSQEVVLAIQGMRRMRSDLRVFVDMVIDQEQSMATRIRFRREIRDDRRLQLFMYVYLRDGLVVAADFPGMVLTPDRFGAFQNTKAFRQYIRTPPSAAACRMVPAGGTIEPSVVQRVVRQQTGKIALCFLTQKGVQRMDMWRPFFDDHDHYTVYYHNDKHNTRSQRSTAQHPEVSYDTLYADNSLVEAEGLMYREALKDRSNKLFVLLSDDSIPLQGSRVFHSMMMAILNDIHAFQVSMKTTTREVISGLFQYQTGNRNTYLAPFLEDSAQQEATITATEYRMPTENDESTHLMAAMQWKILTRVGTTEFISMTDDVRFMSMMDTDRHFDVKDPNIQLHKNADIAPPHSAPDEFNYVAWCNYKNSLPIRQTRRKLLFIEGDIMMHYSIVDAKMAIIRSIGVCQTANAYVDPDGLRWLSFANDGDTIVLPPDTTVRYGEESRFIEKTMGGTLCIGPVAFGEDPAPGSEKYLYHVSNTGLAQECDDDYHIPTSMVCQGEYFSLFARKTLRSTTIQKMEDGAICPGDTMLSVDWTSVDRKTWGPYVESVHITAIKNRCDLQPQKKHVQPIHQQIVATDQRSYQYKDSLRNRRMGRAKQVYFR
jgi:hypothetical protein